MNLDAIDPVVRKYAVELGLDRGYSAHSMHATLITTARSKTARSLRTCKKPPGTATRLMEEQLNFCSPNI
jgi:hypothetical protein